MNTYKRTAANTRKVTNELRALATYLQDAAYAHNRKYNETGAPEHVTTFWEARPYNRTHGSFALEHQSPMRAGCPIVVYPERGEFWVRPASRGDGSNQVVDRTLRVMAAETCYLDVLFDVLEAGGWQAMGGSETRESLAEWRESRRYG